MRILRLQAIDGALAPWGALQEQFAILFDNGTYVTAATYVESPQPLPDRGRYTEGAGETYTFYPEGGGSYTGVLNDVVAISSADGHVFTSTAISVL